MNPSNRKFSWLFALTLCCAVAIPVARYFLFEIDHQFANIAGGIFGALGCIFFTAFAFRYFKWKTIGSIAAGLALVAIALIASLEFKGFTGETLPVFRLRSWLALKGEKSPTVPLKSELESQWKSAAKQATFRQFLGNNRNGVIESEALNMDWDEKPPQLLWKQNIGDGWAGVSIANGMAYTMYQDQSDEVTASFDLLTGAPKWEFRIVGRHSEPLGGIGPRATPTIHNGLLVTQTATGWVLCLNAESGKLVWKHNLLENQFADQTESEVAIKWGRSGSPLILKVQNKDCVLVPLGGAESKEYRTLRMLDLETGQIVLDMGKSQIAYGSPNLIELFGEKQIVTINEMNASGFSLNGQLLWESPWSSHSNADACASQPVSIGNNRILLGKGYALGSKVIELSKDPEGKWKSSDLWQDHRILKTKFTNAVYFDEKLYALSDGVLECVNPETGKRIWRSGRFGQGQMLIVNGKIVITSEDGRLVLADRGDGHVIWEKPILDGITWNIPSVAGPFLIMRNGSEIACLISDNGEDKSTLTQAKNSSDAPLLSDDQRGAEVPPSRDEEASHAK